MTSLPNQNLLVTPGRRHRHKRSAAISGDFDAMGLGLFQPKPTTHASGEDVTSVIPDNDKHYVFNNEEDFKGGQDFSFPMMTPDMAKNTRKPVFPGPPNTLSPRKVLHSSSHSLHSPIRINQHKRSATLNHSKSRFFEDNQSDVPDAVIDLDEILNANLHIGSYSHNSSLGSLHPEFEDDYLASPFLKSAPSSPFFSPIQQNSAPSSLGANNLLFNQPIQESSDLIEEEDERKMESVDLKEEMKRPFDKEYKEVNLPFSQASMYALSANSSCSSFRSAKIPMIEKTFSNSSKESGTSLQAPNTAMGTSAPVAKRSGAKANRYQSFYDQSSRISNAMKISSTESVNIIRSNSSGANIPHTGIPKDRSLGHSSSLPSLKANKNRLVSVHNRLRMNEVRESRSSRNTKETPFVRSAESLSPRLEAVKPQEKTEESASITPTTTHTSKLPVKSHNMSTSPISVHSDVSSAVISSNETIQSTDHSSLASQHEIPGKSRKLQSVPLDRSDTSTPAIVVNGGYEGGLSPSTNSTFKQDEDDKPSANLNESTFIASKQGEGAENDLISTSSKPVLVIENVLSLSSSVSSLAKSPSKRSPRRPMTPAEEKILKLTKIPTFKVSPTPSLASPIESRNPMSVSSPTDTNRSGSLVLAASVSHKTSSAIAPLSTSEFGTTNDVIFSPGYVDKESKASPDTDPGLSDPFRSEDIPPPPLLKSRRRYSTFSLFGHSDLPNKERRGSESFSIVSQPLDIEQKPSASSASRKIRHGKHFSISSDVGLRFGRGYKEETQSTKTKGSRLINWFRKK